MDKKPAYTFEKLHSGIRFHGGLMHAQEDNTYCKIVEPYIAFIILLEGKIYFHLNEKYYRVDAQDQGRLLMMNVNRVSLFQRHIHAHETVHKLTIAGLEKYLSLPKNNTNIEAVQQWILPQELRILANDFLAENPKNTIAKNAKAFNILNICWENYGSLNYSQTASSPIENKEKEKQKIYKSLINAFNNGSNDINKLAEQLNISVRTLQRKTQQLLHCTAQEWLQNTRMQKALHALGVEQLSIGETAYLCGYRHSSNFIQAFRRHFGITPGVLLHPNHLKNKSFKA